MEIIVNSMKQVAENPMADDATNNSQSPSTLSLSESQHNTIEFKEFLNRKYCETLEREKLPEVERRPGTVKAAVQRIAQGNSTVNKFQTNLPQKPFVKTRELHRAKKDADQLTESRKNAELEARSELSSARKMAKELKLRVQESNARAKMQMGDLEKAQTSNGNFECEKVMREVEIIKRDLSKLKMDMASVKEERRRAEKESDETVSKRESYRSWAEALNKEIEEINEEHVLVELARVEAIIEYEELEAHRKERAEMHSTAVQLPQNMIYEIQEAKEVEARLAITMSDIGVLESELKQVKGIQNTEIIRSQDSASLSEPVLKELEATKEELKRVKDESFQFMASMDIVRDELKHVLDQTARLNKEEEESERTVQNLNTKLLKAKNKLEATSAVEDKAKLIVSNLKFTLQHLESEAEMHKKERTLIRDETALLKAEVQKSETEIDLAEERLQAAIQDLKAVKSSDTMALENLKSIVDKTVRNRASASRPSSTITISMFEYEYLKGNAAGAKEIADKKVAAAKAWVGALKASEKEIQIKAELIRRETRELQVEEEHGVHQTEGSTNAKKKAENDFEKWKQKMEPEKLPPEVALGKAMNRNMKRAPTRRGMSRRSMSPVVHGTPRSTTFTVGRRRKVMPNLAKFFSGKTAESDQQPV